MQEIFFTILSAWVIWRLFNSFNNSRQEQPRSNFTANHHHHYYSSKQEGKTVVEEDAAVKKNKKSSADDGEYVDYEELP